MSRLIFYCSYLEHLKPKQVLIEEYKKLRDHLISLNSPVVFCHNDLLPGNIIYNTEKGNILNSLLAGKFFVIV